MPSGKTGASTSHNNRVWKHTKNAPTANRSKGKWCLGVAYYTKISARKQTKRKTSCDQEFSASFGHVGLYETQGEAELDIGRFRMAVDFGTERAGQGGHHKQTTGGGAIRTSPIKRQRTCPDDDLSEGLPNNDANILKEVTACMESMLWKLQRKAKRAKHNEKLRKRGLDKNSHTCNTRIKTARHKRMDKFARMNAARQREENKEYQRVRACDMSQLKQVEWAIWREQVIAHLNKHIYRNTVWKLLDVEVDNPHQISPRQTAILTKKVNAVKNFMELMNERANPSSEEHSKKAEQMATLAGKFAGCSKASVYRYYLEYKVCELTEEC